MSRRASGDGKIIEQTDPIKVAQVSLDFIVETAVRNIKKNQKLACSMRQYAFNFSEIVTQN